MDIVPTPVKSDPTAIPTEYAGYQFRSRLEARWATFFDHAHIEWHYEIEGYQLAAGRYLPDFWLPTISGGAWFEVKGTKPTERESALAMQLARHTGRPVYIAWGQMPADLDPLTGANPTFDIEEFDRGSWDNSRRFCVCPTCRKPGLEFCGRGERICNHQTTVAGGDTWAHYAAANHLARTAPFWNPK